MSKKRLSMEDKRRLMLELFHEQMDVYQLKDLEKIAPREKGIVMQSVKDVLQSLIDEGLVDSEKIGTSLYYWSFPNKAYNTLKNKLNELEAKITSATERLEQLNQKEPVIGLDQEKLAKRDKMLGEIAEKEEILKQKEMANELLELKEKTNMWTDNIFAIRSFVKNKLQLDENTLNRQFGIPAELDYVD